MADGSDFGLQSSGLLPGLQSSMQGFQIAPGMIPGILPQDPQQAQQPQQSGLLPGQQPGQIGYVPPPAPHEAPGWAVLDKLFTGGAVNDARMANYQHMVQQQNMQYQARALGNEYGVIQRTMGPNAAALFASDPQAFMTTALKGGEAANIDGGASRVSPMAALYGGQQFMTAPKLQYNPDIGQSFTQGANGPSAQAQATTPQAKLDPTTGAIVNTLGQVTGSVPVPMKLSNTERLAYGGGAGPLGNVASGTGWLPGTGGMGADTAPQASPSPSGASYSGPTPGGATGAQIVQAAQRYGVPPALALGVGNAESRLNPATPPSVAGAIGTMQLMPGTARGLGVNPNDPQQNIDGGVHYLSQMLQRYGGNPSLAASAYNAGPGNVTDHIPQNGQTPDYVSKVLASMQQYGGAGGGASAAPPSYDPNAPQPQGAQVQLGAPVPGNGQGRLITGANGLPEAAPGSLTRADLQGMRANFMGKGGAYDTAMSARAPLNSLAQLADPTGSNNGTVDMAAVDTLLKAINQPNAQVRNGIVHTYLEHIGAPGEIEGKVQSLFGKGFLPQQILQDIYRTAHTYATEKANTAQQRANADETFAQRNGWQQGDTGEAVAPMPDVPKWAQDTVPAAGQRKVGATYWAPKGPLVWRGKGWARP